MQSWKFDFTKFIGIECIWVISPIIDKFSYLTLFDLATTLLVFTNT